MLSFTSSHGNSVYDWNTMPRSGPGPLTGAPSSSTRPAVGVSSPATMRSKVDFPQPDGPRIAMKSLSATENEIGSIACVDARPRRPGKRRVTCSMVRRATLSGDGRRWFAKTPSAAARHRSGETPREQPLVHRLEEGVGDQADHPDHDDAAD